MENRVFEASKLVSTTRNPLTKARLPPSRLSSPSYAGSLTFSFLQFVVFVLMHVLLVSSFERMASSPGRKGKHRNAPLLSETPRARKREASVPQIPVPDTPPKRDAHLKTIGMNCGNKSETGQTWFRRARYQTPNSVSFFFFSLTEFRVPLS